MHTDAPQPLLHDLVSCVRAPALALSGPDGQVRPGGVHGFFRSDVRTLSRFELRLDGRELEPISGQSVGADEARFVGLARWLGDPEPDPTVIVERRRRLTPGGVVEQVSVASAADAPVTTSVEIEVACDLASMDTVKVGEAQADVAADVGRDLRWTGDGITASLRADPPPDRVEGTGRLVWDVALQRGQQWTVRLEHQADVPVVHASEGEGAVFTAATDVPWSRPAVRSPDPSLAHLVDQGLDDLGGLLLTENGHPFLAAGSPWFLTLFGRDALWSARLLLPLGTDLAIGTLRVLAARQGSRVDLATEEQPGKILHEVRRQALHTGDLMLPPVYFGTVDATPLWVTLLSEAWRWGADAADVAGLLPAAERALRWMVEYGDTDGDGFVEYEDHTGHGLSNQGWKDSGDSIQWADGRLAQGPIALCEVQGYAYEAAIRGADLLEAFGVAGTDEWRDWADRLAARFRAQFWVADADGPYPAVALDRENHRVDSVASNMGHLLGTGLLDADESALVAARIAGADMDSGFGLRTLSARSARFAPLSYHGGSVWPHDTAIAVAGLARAGHHDVASRLLHGLIDAAPAFDFRLPELFGGEQRFPGHRPVPYPASCRPQAWAAAAGVGLLAALVGLDPDVPNGEVGLDPVRPAPGGRLVVEGLRLGGSTVTVAVEPDDVTVTGLPDGVRVRGPALREREAARLPR